MIAVRVPQRRVMICNVTEELANRCQEAPDNRRACATYRPSLIVQIAHARPQGETKKRRSVENACALFGCIGVVFADATQSMGSQPHCERSTCLLPSNANEAAADSAAARTR